MVYTNIFSFVNVKISWFSRMSGDYNNLKDYKLKVSYRVCL